MKQRIANLICAVLSLAVFIGAPAAVAQTDSGNDSSDTTQNEETTEAKALRERLEKKKAEFRVNLSLVDKERLKNRCKPAQALIKTESEKVAGRVVVRTRAYAKLVEHLNSLVSKLEAKNVDVAELTSQIATLETKIAKFDTDLDAYKQTLSDLRILDCRADPDAFKAALEAARAARDTLVSDAADIKTYVKDTIKVTLQAIRAGLEAQENESENTN